VSILEQRLRATVEGLCSPSCAGRATGSPQGEAARALIIEAFVSTGLRPVMEQGSLWEQLIAGSGGANVVGRIPSYPNRGGLAVLLGAHYDHLGWRVPGVEAFWGADDNAAAVAILIEVGRLLTARLPASVGLNRDIILCAFDGEEPPHFLTSTMGSEYFARHPPLPLENIDLVIALDLVGHAVGREGFPAEVRETLFILGAELSEGTPGMVDSIPPVKGMIPRRVGINVLPPLSDYYPFQQRGIPFLFLTGGRWRHYHKTSDTPDRLDYGKMAATVGWLEQLVRVAATSHVKRLFLTGGRDDQTTLRTLGEIVRPLVRVWPHAAKVLGRIDALSASLAGGRLPPSAFTELLTLVAVLESALGGMEFMPLGSDPAECGAQPQSHLNPHVPSPSPGKLERDS
jgi:peptidase M28-like protein